MTTERESLFPAGCTCLSYGRGLTMTRVRAEGCPVHAPRSRARHPFWLDGGYDFDSVQACPYHPAHRWITVRLGDVLRPGAMRDPDELMTFCQGCYAPRCGTTADADRCTLWRHHATEHVYDSGAHEPVGGFGVGMSDRP